jgi:RNA polymerase sigma factor (sigma-70 family)
VQPLATDDSLIARCRDHGDQEAFAELVRRYREPVFRLALSILGAGFSGEAEEVAQEVFLRVYHALTTFRGEAQFSSWIYRIAFNQALNLKARVRYRATHLGEQVLAPLKWNRRTQVRWIASKPHVVIRRLRNASWNCRRCISRL